jgi:hypothetical protein
MKLFKKLYSRLFGKADKQATQVDHNKIEAAKAKRERKMKARLNTGD